MKSQIELAKAGVVSQEMKAVAKIENQNEETIRGLVVKGQIVIPNNPYRTSQNSVGIGTGLRTKVNASIGTSSDICDVNLEVRKAKAAQEEGADTLMELSASGDIDVIRRNILETVSLPVGTVPLYQAFYDAAKKYGNPNKLDPEYLFEIIERQLADGISFMAIHCGINQYSIERLKKQGFRYGGLASKGGTFLASWMETNKKENPLYEQFDRVCALMKKYDAVLSLGNGLRSAAIWDSHDRAQMAEMITNCELAELGREMGCQTMVEGPGHIPLDEIEANIKLEKLMSGNSPYYVLGPIPIDNGAGYDHIASAIGAAQSARYGADLVCYITPAEHLALPNEDDVRQGVRATRIAVATGDVVKYPYVKEEQKKIALCRRDMKWDELNQYLLFTKQANQIRDSRMPSKEETCTMCGDFCAMKNGNEVFSEFISEDKKFKEEVEA